MLTERGDRNVQNRRLRDVLDRQIASDLQFVLAGLFDLVALEGRCREFFGLEEVCAQKVVVALVPESVQTVDVDREFDRGILGRIGVDQQFAVPVAEASFGGRIPKVIVGECQVGMRLVEVVSDRVGERSARQERKCKCGRMSTAE